MNYITKYNSVTDILRYLHGMEDYYKDSIKFFKNKKNTGFLSFLFKKHNKSMDEQIKVCEDEIQVIKTLYDETIETIKNEIE